MLKGSQQPKPLFIRFRPEPECKSFRADPGGTETTQNQQTQVFYQGTILDLKFDVQNTKLYIALTEYSPT